MEALRWRHSRAMIHRAVPGLVISTCLVACLGKTTSLGGPDGSQSSVSSAEDDAGSEGGQRLPPRGDDALSGSGGLQPPCHGYTWDPVRSSVACQYLLPSGKPPNDDPRLDPMSWDPNRVTVEIVIPMSWSQGRYKATADDCGISDGWYYVPPADAQKPTDFALCPTSCASVSNDEALLRLTAITYCE